MTNYEFVEKLKYIADHYKTSYMLGCWGFLATDANINEAVSRTDVTNSPYLSAAQSIKNVGWLFDCVNLIKAVLWGFTANTAKPRGGGAVYASNGCPDINADSMILKCSGVTTDFSNIEVGEAVWLSGHIGVYIGNNQCIECTPKWTVSPSVKYSNLANKGNTSGNSRTWTKHGKLPYITYLGEDEIDMTKDQFLASLTDSDIKAIYDRLAAYIATPASKEEIVQGITNQEATGIYYKAISEIKTQDGSDYSKKARSWAVDKGLLQGDGLNLMWQAPLTREEFATAMQNLEEK